MNFPRQVKKANVLDALRNFYQSVDENIKETYRDFDGGVPDNLEEIDFNQRKFHEVIRQIKQGKEKVTVEFYDVEVISGSQPRIRKRVNSFQLSFRYGTWFRQENVVN